MNKRMRLWLAAAVWLLAVTGAEAEHVRDLEVSEGAPVGTRVGFIGDGSSSDSGPPYLIVPVPGSAVDTELSIEQNTGEIRTKVPLDRETRASYSLVAIPLSGENVRVVVRVLDENDNAPTFPSPVMSIEFPENTPRDVKRTLNPARDLDLGIYNTQRYNIVSGNVNNAFRLSSHRERDGVLYLDLQINGFLDRETTAAYSLLIEALDGGSPPLKGQMTVNITIQDVNDNQPIFNQSRYFATVPENATVGTSILQVHATDADANENGEVEYSINRRQSDKESMFRIDSKTGLISVNRPLDFETKEVHELVVVAKDHGVQPLETTAFVSIRVTDVNDNQPTINVIFLSDDATPKISEMAQPGEFVARISVNDPDSKTEYSNVNVTLEGGEGHFGLATQDNIIYLVIVALPIDREQKPNYTLSVIATDTGTPPLHASRTFHLRVTDINDNAPEFKESVYYANVLEVADPGTSVFQVQAMDIDEGENSVLTYSLQENTETHASWFQIDSRSGLITTKAHIDCETDPIPQLTVIATDSGSPPLSSSATVLVTIHDVNDNEPIFDRSYYNVTVSEDKKDICIQKVSATDPDCGLNAMVNYTLGDVNQKLPFEVNSNSGEICIVRPLDYETKTSYEFPVIATDRGGLSTMAMVKVQVTDVNDNRPVFFPREYNVSLRSGTSASGSVVVVVSAVDRDSSRFGTVTYQITSGNEGNLFRIDRNSGEIFINQPSLAARAYRLNVSVTDGAGLKGLEEAEVFVTVSDRPLMFEKLRYSFTVREDVPRNTLVGAVKASSDGYRSLVRYSITAGDSEGYFTIDPASGAIRTVAPLDHEVLKFALLNIQATSDSPSATAYAQVKIIIDDVNDNSPEFEFSTVRLSVPENTELGIPLYAAYARDGDSDRNGLVRYRLMSASSGDARLFTIDSRLGHLTLARHLDYETAQRHSLVIAATDSGDPSLSSNLTVLLEVQDVNDNPPVFERTEYSVRVSESIPVNSQIVQVTAVDLDTGNNARLTYRLLASANSLDTHMFGIFPNSGWVYLRHPLDRETRDRYSIRVIATDNGTPASSTSALVTVQVLDANDNDPVFDQEAYQFSVEENLPRGALVGTVRASDKDLDNNGALRYSLIPSNSSFQINPVSGEIFTREPLDREARSMYELVAEARDQGSPPRSARVSVKVSVSDVNDNAPDLVDPQEDVISVREEQPPGTEVVRVRAVDRDEGHNATVTYSIVKGRDTDGYGVFTVDQVTGLIRTKTVLDHEERAIYRLAVAATDGGYPPKETVRVLRVEVLDLNDNRPTFTSSSLVFNIKEDVPIGYVVGNVVTSDSGDGDNLVSGRAGGGHVMYTLTSLSPLNSDGAFDMDRSTGSLVVARQLDRETHSEYKLEVRALDTSTSNNPQSSAVVVRVQLSDVNDNAPQWDQDPITITVPESASVGSAVWNFSATDADGGANGELRYSLLEVWPHTQEAQFSVDPLTGTLTVVSPLDFETVSVFTMIVRVTDQAPLPADRLSSSLTVRVVVQDVNDNAPQFVSPAAKTVAVMEDSKVGQSICQMTAVDKDSGENSRVTYTITSGNEDGKFTLGYATGVLALARTLDVSTGNGISPKYRLNVTASDHGSPAPKKTTISLTLVVQGSTEIPPRFIQTTYQANISEDAAVGTTVIKVTAGSGTRESGGGLGNLSFHMVDDKFAVDPTQGTITLTGTLDREIRDNYVIPVYVTDTLSYDVATVSIHVTDVNDHSPEFRPGACYPLTVPENSDFAVVHTLTATDPDSGANGEITYSVTGGNIGNKFSIDMHSGELSARPLDRETQPRYQLVITAQDRGNPPLSGSCNITVTVEDQNDNDPRFSKLRYTATILEDVEVGTPVLTVKASDADLGINAKLVYSLANESQWLFQIDNRTGVITTAGTFDRERLSVYEFQVVATDGGRYDARSQKVPVQITIGDVNDNKPVFSHYPFTAEVPAYTQPGHEILHITAVDNDEGTNADIVFSFVNEPPMNKFRINPNSGSVTAASSLAMESGKLFHLEVLATDKGNPPQSATGLIEIKVGESFENSQVLRFQNSTYNVYIPENSAVGKEILQVSAVRSDGRRQKITYTLASGNEERAFDITLSGVIRVRDSRKLDYEASPTLKLVVMAQAEGSTGPSLYGYAQVLVNLIDQNDNTPKFTQQQYSAVVWEGNNKGTFVMQVSATDMDQGSNARLLYHIVDGNHDNAFVIEPPFSGLVKTNIVLDREIRDMYRLTVIATDEGVPQLTGTSTIRINIVDVNDNQPTFPPHSVVSIGEGKEVGSVITTVSANDVDTNPALTYSLQEEEGVVGVFSIDRFSGKVILGKPLDYETRQEYRLKITVSDTAHTAATELTVKVTDDNDNSPIFSQAAYKANLLDSTETGGAVVVVNATDLDSGSNSEIHYSLLPPMRGFTIDELTGAIQVNRSVVVLASPWSPVLDLVVVATDAGNPPLSSTAAVRIHINNAGRGNIFGQDEFRITVNERTEKGASLLKLGNTAISKHVANPQYTIIDGNSDNTFQMLSPQGELLLLNHLDRETKDTYLLRITSSPLADNSSALQIHVTVADANDNAPKFVNIENRVYLSEGVSVGHLVLQISANDADLPPNSDIRYNITSGNDEDLFEVDLMSGVVTVKNQLDYDTGPSEYALVVSATDNAKPPDLPLSTVETVHIILEDENDNTPHFPVSEYLEFVGENEAIGSPVFTARATDIDKGMYGQLNYSIMSAAASGFTDIEDSWKMFRVDPVSGLVTTNAVFDYESRNRYAFTLTAGDIGGRTAKVKVRIEIESRDEFHPQFTERTYRFVLGTNDLPSGYIVGHVTATDRDKGPDGRVVYQLSSQHPYFKINRTTGSIMVKKKFDSGFDFKQDISLVVTASSGRQGSLTNMSVVEIALDPLADTESNIVVTGSGNDAALAATSGGIADWAMGLLIALILIVLAFGAVFLFLHVRNRRHKKVNKPGLSGGQSTDSFVDPSAFDTIPIRGGVAGPASQFGPPKYDEIPTYRNNNTSSSNSGAATTSELSGSEQSGSSGRGSAEDGEDVEDEEIRMINEGPLQREGLHRSQDDEDNLSDVSVHNTQEYLARLGIVDSQGTSSASRRHSESLVASSSKDGLMHHQGVPIDGLHMFDEDTANENDITNLIYAKLNDVSGSDRGSSTEDVGSNSNGALGAAVDHVMVLGGFGDVPNGTHQPSMTGSLSSIVHSEEELTGSYNWDYLLDWGPQYQPLAHVFSEIARLKDDAASVKSGNSGASSGKGKNCPPPIVKTVPPPLLTSVAPRSIAAPVLSARTPHHSSVGLQPPQMLLLPRSPISHDASGAGFSTSTAMSPSFSPSLSPLATRSPSISPLVTPGVPTSHHVRQRTTDSELRI